MACNQPQIASLYPPCKNMYHIVYYKILTQFFVFDKEHVILDVSLDPLDALKTTKIGLYTYAMYIVKTHPPPSFLE